MSQYSTRQILDMIEENEGPRGLDLSGADLREIDLSRETMQAELERARKNNPEIEPAWVSKWGGINLRGVNLQEANLSPTPLQGADLRGARLQRAFLWGAYLQGANLRGTDLQWANLRRADLQGSFFAGARLDHTEIDQRSLLPGIGDEVAKEYHWARDAYLRLKQNFDGLGDYAASAWAYQKERQMEKQCHAPWRARSIYWIEFQVPSTPRVFLFYARHTVKWVLDWIVEYLCGYGESIGRVLFWMTASLIASATYYWHIGGVWLVDPGKGPIATARSFWHYLIYSLGAFTTTQFATLEPADDRVRLITGVQAIWGIFLAGLLGFVVANKIRRS